MEADRAHPLRHQRAPEFDAVARIDGFLALERQTVGVFGDGDLRQQRRSVAFAAGDIEHIQAGHQRAGEQVAVIVLDLDLAADGRGQPLAGEGSGCCLAAKDVNS